MTFQRFLTALKLFQAAQNFHTFGDGGGGHDSPRQFEKSKPYKLNGINKNNQSSERTGDEFISNLINFSNNLL